MIPDLPRCPVIGHSLHASADTHLCSARTAATIPCHSTDAIHRSIVHITHCLVSSDNTLTELERQAAGIALRASGLVASEEGARKVTQPDTTFCMHRTGSIRDAVKRWLQTSCISAGTIVSIPQPWTHYDMDTYMFTCMASLLQMGEPPGLLLG